MSLTPLQERRLLQVQQEIAFFEKQTSKRRVWFAVWFSAVTVIIIYSINFFGDWITDATSISSFVSSLSWVKIVGTWVFWFLFDYFFFVRSNFQQLKLKTKELSQLKAKYDLVEEPLS